MSLHFCAILTEPPQLAHIKQGHKYRRKTNVRPLQLVGNCASGNEDASLHM